MSGFADENGYSGSESTSPKYSIHPTFSGAYYNDITKPEDYYTNATILNDIIEAFSKFVKEHEQYGYLRIIDISKIEVGDNISVLGLEGEHEIAEIADAYIMIKHNDALIKVSKANIRLIDDCLSKLKRTDISFIYTEINKIILNDHYSCIEFFNIFSEYFKINEKTLYSSLPYKIQLELMNSLKERLNISIIDPENQLPTGRKVLIMRGEYASCDDPDIHHVFNTEMYGEVIGLVKNPERSKIRVKIRIETETSAGEENANIITRLSKIKLFGDGDIDLIW